MNERVDIPLSITARQKGLVSRPPIFTQNNIVETKSKNVLVQGFQDYVIQKNKTLSADLSVAKSTKVPFNYFKVLNQNSVIVHLPVHGKCILCGYFRVTIIFGHVSVFGFDLKTNSQMQSVTFFGSNEFKSFLIKAKPHSEERYYHLKDIFNYKIPLSETDISTLMSIIDGNDSILLVEELPLPSVYTAKQYINPILFPLNEKSNKALRNCGKWLEFATENEYRGSDPTFKESPEWYSLLLGERNVIIGGEGTGKSTLTKFLINQLLNVHSQVLFLELDIGQGEFTPPGCVALLLVRQPVLGPNFTHIVEPERMIHLGEADAGKCSSEYLASVKILANDINGKFSGLPLVVNTMGYCKGLGLHLTLQTIGILKPSTVIQLNSESMKKNFEKHLTPEVLSYNGINVSYQFFLVQSISAKSKRVGTKREARERMLISYFSSVLIPPHFSFNTAQPFCVSFADISIGVTSNISIRDVLSALNGSLVALCEKPAADAVILKVDTAEWFSIVLKPSVQHCLGLGLIRGIDMDKHLIYILTPLCISKMQKVSLLQMSHVEVPSIVFTKQEGVDGLVPYVTQTTHDLSLVSVKRIFRQP